MDMSWRTGAGALLWLLASCVDDTSDSLDSDPANTPASTSPQPQHRAAPAAAAHTVEVGVTRFAFLRGTSGFIETGSTDWYARASGKAMAFAPVPSYEGELPAGGLTLRTESISRGSWRWPSATAFSTQGDGRVTRAGAGVEEWFRGRDVGLEQGWTFDGEPAGAGPITVHVSVDGAEFVDVDEDGVHLSTAAGGVRYGHGAWIDATGTRTAVPVTWSRGGIQLTVPAELVARSAFPATLDPIIGPEQTTDPVVLGLDELNPLTHVVECSPSVCMAFWADDRGARAVRFLDNGTVLELPRTVVADPTAEVGGIGVQGNQFMLTWTTGSSTRAVDAQYWSDAGGPTGLPVRVAEEPNLLNSDVACSSDRCLVAWRSFSGLISKRIDANGAVIDPLGTSLSADGGNEAHVLFDGVNFVVGSGSAIRRVTPAGVNLDPAGVLLGFGGQGVADLATDGVDTLVLARDAARIFRPDGTLGPLVPLPVTGLPNWFTVDWVGSRYLAMLASGTSAQALDASGALLGSEFPVASLGFIGRVSARPSGGLFTHAGDGILRAQRVDSAGSLVGSTFSLNPAANPQHEPNLVAGNGQFLLTWADRRLGAWGIYAQRLALTGAPLDVTPLLLMTSTVKPVAVAAAFDGTNYVVVRSGTEVRARRLPLTGPPLDAEAGSLIDSSSSTVDMAVAWDGTNFGLAQLQVGSFPFTTSARFARISPAGLVQDSPTILVTQDSTLRSVSLAFDGTAHNFAYESPTLARMRRLSPGATFVGPEITLPIFSHGPLAIGCGIGDCVISDGAQTITPTGIAVPTASTPSAPTVCTAIASIDDELILGTVAAATGTATLTRLGASAPHQALGDWFPIDGTAEPETSLSIAGFDAGTILVAYERFSELDAASRIYVRAIGSAADGTACSAPVDCASGFCVEGVCCDTACGDGLADDCLVCSVANGAALDGVCGPRPAGELCRSSTAPCDAAEVCDGVTTTCPSDALAGPSVECRAASSGCDAAETCTGLDLTCPDDQPAAAGTTCRAEASECDVAEQCDGGSFDCPADASEPDGTACGNDSVCEGGVCVSESSGGGGSAGGSANGGSANGGASNGGSAEGGAGGSPVPAPSEEGGCQTSPARGSRGGPLLAVFVALMIVSRRACTRSSGAGFRALFGVFALMCGSMGCSSAADDLFGGAGVGGDAPGGGAAGTGGVANSGGAPAGSGGMTGAAGSSTGGTSGEGGGGGGSSPTVCTPGDTKPCYDGPAGTEGVGLCEAGSRTCAADGSTFGPCEGQVQPAEETCETPADEDCDGQANEGGVGCACNPGSVSACYTGPANTAGVGLCAMGTQTCNSDGLGYGSCLGQILPVSETCNNLTDEDCDGQTNEGGSGCLCVANSFSSCYDGPQALVGVGVCVAGFRQCNALGTAFGPCTGQVLPAPEDCSQLADEDCDGSTPSCNGAVIWSKGIDGTGDENVPAVTTDGTGHIIVTGSFTGSINLGGSTLTSAGSLDIFVAKYAPDGSHVWSVRFGDANAQFPRAVASDADGNILVTGRMSGSVNFGGGPLVSQDNDVFLVKLTSAGGHVWSKRFGDFGTEDADKVVIDGSGNVIITGSFEWTIDLGGGVLSSAGSADQFLAKFDPNGAPLWSRRYGGSFSEYELRVAVDSSDNLFLTGTFSGSSSGWGGPPSISNGSSDAFVVKLDPDGNHVWTETFSGSGSEAGVNITTDATGDVLILGYTDSTSVDFGGGPLLGDGSLAVFFVKLDTDGNHLWSRRDGGGVVFFFEVRTDSDGNVHAAGYLYEGASVDLGGGPLTSAGLSDVLVLALDDAGNHLWSKRFGGAQSESAASLSIDPAGEVVMVGSYSFSIDFGDGPLPLADFYNSFLVKLAN
jgi:hypothetical protein